MRVLALWSPPHQQSHHAVPVLVFAAQVILGRKLTFGEGGVEKDEAKGFTMYSMVSDSDTDSSDKL